MTRAVEFETDGYQEESWRKREKFKKVLLCAACPSSITRVSKGSSLT